MIKLPYGWDSAVQAAKEANGNGSLNNMQIAASIILELDSQLRSPAQTKTVADAVEQEKEWRLHNYKYLGYNTNTQRFVYGNKDKWSSHEYFVCTREQFETYVKEQEGEKWTHTWKGDNCRVVFTEGASSWIKGHFISTIVHTESLKPIKPTISETEAIGILKVNKHLSFAALLEDYDVVKD